jgi:RNA polymerase sigma factor (sigma-70 family)
MTALSDDLGVVAGASPQSTADRPLPPAGRPDPSAASESAPGSADTWQQAWTHREALLRVARRRSVSHADAEDAVAEAIARSHEDADVDFQRVGGWLTSVTMRLCADSARDRAREPKRVAYQLRQGVTEDDHGPAVCDRAEASWLAAHLAGLPARQRRALELRAQGADVGSIAESMGVSYKVADGLLQRARAHMKAVLSTAAAWVGSVLAALVALGRRRTGATATVALAAAGAAIISGGLQQPAPSIEQVAPAAEASEPAVIPTPAAVGPAVPPAEPAAPPAEEVVLDKPTPPAPFEAPATVPSMPSSVELPEVAVPTRAPTEASVAGVEVSDGGSSYHRPEQDFVQSTKECLERGPEISLTMIGCNPE